ncbi:(Fe-S)-binding protein [Nocardia donostiensis]|uniref:Fe-S oxidoreductase n=1 Tax=Nocardia donostiensis TaxID=1538463 RepID=A0A1V2TIV6_9NOCA|nr:(Fe-S)-binding protein [Nocardia donostiensis]ONM49470.1 Fe-S oxidoreductase [Nocardia donostiensis]OQS13551.1 Fe-S oxidoreductase [Nocardia donostiensis]OQS19947.1 Fe-S oxidoreductase [Nocardia donostiensis]
MNALTVTLGTIGAALSILCWASFIGGVRDIVRSIMLGQPAPDRWRPFFPRFKQMVVEFLAHTRMNKFRTVGWAHWLVMIGFMGGAILWFEAYGQTFDPAFHWPIIGNLAVYHLWDEILGIGTVIGIGVLIAIRQLNHPRVPDRLSRFSGSVFGAAYVIEAIVLLEGLGMIFVKAGKIATYGHANPATDFFTMQVAKLLPASPVLVSVFAFIKLMSGMAFLYLVGRNITWGVAWHRFSAFPNIYFKREDDGGVALGAAKPMMSKGKALDMENVDPDTDTLGAGRIEDFSWKGWLDFTTCTECGRCQSQCPAWNTGKPLSPKLLIMSLRDHGRAKAPYLLAGGRKDMGGDEIGLVDADGNPDEAKLAKISEATRAEAERPLVGGEDVNGIIDPEVLWSCTTCGACVEQCPVDIEHVDHIIDMRRYQVLIESEFPSELAGLFKNLENKGNPWGQNAKDRLNWINELDFDVPVFGKDADSFDGYEYLFWVGCAGAYEDRAKKTTKAVAELLATAGVKYMVLGAEETCTGDSARRAGNEFLFQQLAQQNIETLNSVFEGVEQKQQKIVVTCAHCFNALNNEYPQVGGTYEVVHHTQLLNRLVRQKQLIPVASVSQNVTYHDPCYLGRHNKIYNAPRELMEASGSTLVEMPRHGERSMCCGAGGARMWMEEQLGKRVNIDRVDEALTTNPAKIATGCPFCRVMLTDGVTARQEGGQGEGVEVIDVAQLMLDSIERIEPAKLTENLTVIQEPKAAPEPEPEPEPVAEAAAPAQKAAPTGGGLAMKGPAKAPGKGLGMKGAAKAPGAKAPAAETTEAAPAKGLGMKGAAKAPGGKGLAMKGAAKAPGAKAETAPAAEAETTEAKPVKGLGMKGAAKAPGGKGLAMKGAAKAPGAKAPAAKAEPAADTETPESAATETAAGPTETKPTVAAKGLAMKSGFKRPGPKAPDTKASAPAPAAEPAEEATATPEATAEAAQPSEPTETKPTVPAKGLAMKSGFKRPGPKAPGAKATAPAPAAAAEAPETEATEPSEPAATGSPEAEPKTAGNGAPPPQAKPGALGFKSGAKAPGRKS